MPASAADVIRHAVDHTAQQLFKPFRFGQWVRLAVTGLLAGELSGAGGCGVRIPWRPPTRDSSAFLLAQAAPGARMLLMAAIPLLIVVAILLIIALVYISSRMRFVLFDSVVTKECRIQRYWAQRREPAFRYFLFQLLFALTMLSVLALFAGTAFAVAFAFGWLRNPRQHLLPLILLGVVFFLIIAVFVILATAVAVLTKDFVVPQMALENVSVGEGWRRLWLMINQEKAGYAGYVGLKILLSLGAAIVMGIGAITVVLVLAIPMALIALIAVFGGRAIGLVWNIYTLSLAIAAGSAGVAILIFGVLVISAPVIVFFPAYSLYFLAARYPALNTAMHVTGN